MEQSEPLLAAGLRQILLDCRQIEQESDLDPVEDMLRQCLGKDEKSASHGKARAWQMLKKVKIPFDEPDFMQGYALAKEARRQLQLDSRPITDVAETLRRLDVNLEKGRSTPLYRAAALAIEGQRAHIVPSLSGSHARRPPVQNFAVASALGRVLWDARDPDKWLICVAQGDYSLSSESPRANAFAAEFLLPGRVVRGLRPGSSELREKAERYGVSEVAANWHARNAVEHSL